MDCRATLAPAAEKLTVEQAIFTSVPGPMGAGYRIVGQTTGISSDEKRELVQRAPSHGNLCGTTADATGFACFPLSSGRFGAYLSRHAGTEHTARGGYRVCTLLLVLSGDDLARCGHVPARIEAAVRPHLDAPAGGPLRSHLELMKLDCPADLPATTPPPGPDTERLLGVLAALLSGERVLVVGAPQPTDAVRWLFEVLPWSWRTEVSVSHGVRPAPARDFRLVFADAQRAEIERTTYNQSIVLVEWGAPPPVRLTAYTPWLNFVRKSWQAGRHADVANLARALDEERRPKVLEHCAWLALHRGQIATATPEDVAEWRPALEMGPKGLRSPVMERLHTEFDAALKQRAAALGLEPKAAPGAGNTTPVRPAD